MYEKESDIAERMFAAIKDEDVDAINRGLHDFSSIGWRMVVVYRFITKNNDKISCISYKDYGLLFLINGKFDLRSHKKYIKMFDDSRKDKKILDQHFKSRNDMNDEELKWLNSATQEEIVSLRKYI